MTDTKKTFPRIPYLMTEEEFVKIFGDQDILSKEKRLSLARNGSIWACAIIVDGITSVHPQTVFYEDFDDVCKACELHNVMAHGMTKEQHFILIAQNCIS